MLDVRAAVLAAAGAQARISVVTVAPTAGTPLALSAASSLVAVGHSIVTYQWALVDGGGIVSAFIGATNAATVSAQPTAAGTFTVKLTVTDDLGVTSSATLAVAVAAAPVVVVAPPAATSSGGGGALGAGWLLLLLTAVLALAAETRRERAVSARATGSRRR